MLPISVILTVLPAGLAQDGEEGTEPSDEQTLAEEQKKLLELEKDIQQLQLDLLRQRLPTADLQGRKGELSFGTDVGYFGRLLTYDALGTVARAVADEIGAPPAAGTPLFLTANPDLVGLQRLHGLVGQRLQSIQDAQSTIRNALAVAQEKSAWTGSDFEVLADPGDTLALAPELLGGAAQIASVFRVDTEVGSKEVELEERATLAQVAGALTDQGWSVRLWQAPSSTEAGIIAQLQDRLRVQAELEAQFAGLDKGERTGAGGKLVKARLDALGKALTELNTQLYATSSGPSLAERLTVVDGAAGTRLLWVHVESAGQETIVTKGAWRTVVSHLGGLACSFVHLSDEGAVIDSGTLTAWEGRKANARRLHRLRKQR